MYKKLASIFMIGGALTAGAQESDWKLSLGTTFRSFKQSELKSIGFGSDKYVNGSYDGSTVTVDDAGNQVAPYPGGLPGGTSHLASLHSVSFGSFSEDLEDSAGLVLQWTKDLQGSGDGKIGGLDWQMDFSLVWVGVDQAFNSAADVTSDAFEVDDSDFPNGTIDDVENGVPGAPSLLPGSKNVEGFARYDLDVDAFTMGFGFGPRLELGPVDLKIGVGPTLTIVNYNTRVDAGWNFIGDAGSGERVSRSDDGIDARLGLYGSVGLACEFTERWGMEVGVRYDYIPDSVDTNIVNLDLSGLSTEIKVVYSF